VIVGTTADKLRLGQPDCGKAAARTKNLSEARVVPILPDLSGSFCISRNTRSKTRVLWYKLGKSQANESMWGMPGHIEAMKAAVSCDKLGGAAHTH
jgi:hypothetical protein